MDFKTIKSIDDPLFKAALKLYDGQFDIDLSEDEQIFKQSLKMNIPKMTISFSRLTVR